MDQCRADETVCAAVAATLSGLVADEADDMSTCNRFTNTAISGDRVQPCRYSRATWPKEAAPTRWSLHAKPLVSGLDWVQLDQQQGHTTWYTQQKRDFITYDPVLNPVEWPA